MDKFGKKIIDFDKNNLHLINYSTPQDREVNKKDLLLKLHYDLKNRDAIPYKTSYYVRDWGFCITKKQRNEINLKYKDLDKFKIKIDSKLDKNGYLNYAELFLPGRSKQEILISTYICHPSMANNELSGPIISMSLINFFKKQKLDKGLRFIFVPETIGSVGYLQKNIDYLKKYVVAGLQLTCVGDERQYSCLLTKYQDQLIDRIIVKTYKKLNLKFKKYNFLERGSDERQYNSPHIDLPIASIFRSKYGTYPEYHTSKDDFKVVTLKGLKGSFRVAKKIIITLQNSIIPISKNKCETQLYRKNLSKLIKKNKVVNSRNILNFLQYCDGKNDLELIAKYINLKLSDTKKILKLAKIIISLKFDTDMNILISSTSFIMPDNSSWSSLKEKYKIKFSEYGNLFSNNFKKSQDLEIKIIFLNDIVNYYTNSKKIFQKMLID